MCVCIVYLVFEKLWVYVERPCISSMQTQRRATYILAYVLLKSSNLGECICSVWFCAIFYLCLYKEKKPSYLCRTFFRDLGFLLILVTTGEKIQVFVKTRFLLDNVCKFYQMIATHFVLTFRTFAIFYFNDIQLVSLKIHINKHKTQKILRKPTIIRHWHSSYLPFSIWHHYKK